MSNLSWTLAAVNRTGLPALPHDLLLHVYSFLDVPDAVVLSETCRSLHGFAASRAAWLTLARTLAASKALALPAEKQLTTIPADLTTDEMRAVVRQTTKLANNLNLPNPTLSPIRSLALPEAATIHGGTFACWDLATTEPTSSQPPLFPRRRSMRTQTNSLDGVDAEMGSESDDDMHPEYDVNSPGDELRRPRCVAAWETKAEYVEFAYDLVPGGVLVALMVAVQVGHNPPILKRDMYVVRIDLPTSTAPVPVPPGQYPGPPNPFGSCLAPPVFAGRHHGLRFLAHSPLRQPVFISTTFINASGHAGILGDIPDTMVVFILLFDPNVPLTSSSLSLQPSLVHPIRCASSLVHCGFKVAPGMRYTALGTPTHVILYAESTLKTIARRIEVRSLRRRWTASPVPITTPVQCVDLGIKVLGTPRSREFIGSPGTEGAPLFTTVRAMLRKANPKWLHHELVSTPNEARDTRFRRRRARKKSLPETVCALGLSVDVEDRRADVFRGLVLGAHDIAPDSEEEPGDDDDGDDDIGTSTGSRPRTELAFGSVLSTLADSYSLPTPSQSSLLQPTQVETSSPSSSSSSASIPVLPLRRPFRRSCRVRYKRTIFPAHVNYAHELAGMGSFGRYAAWIEGDGVPEEVDWQKESLRVMIAPLTRETGAEAYPELANEEPARAETAIRQSAASLARVLSVPDVFQPKLNMVSCLAFEDAAGVLALSTIEGQVHVFGLAA
ncbi:hypothetical protein RSOLAG22IIIB_06857 [Rhizoctonia solani]|uniref:F-box domain-containing protein n=1 Tax=Rhizoctonia solani TaxID=456999 RepID=A0A0K6GHQ7_9AGAM|nr:hypothetical protein RSOLAG22IIIB_06857 [Rhizoctonia solani]